MPDGDWEAIGKGDLRLQFDQSGGFDNVILRDADDGDVIVLGEDDIRPLRDRLTRILEEGK